MSVFICKLVENNSETSKIYKKWHGNSCTINYARQKFLKAFFVSVEHFLAIKKTRCHRNFDNHVHVMINVLENRRLTKNLKVTIPREM